MEQGQLKSAKVRHFGRSAKKSAKVRLFDGRSDIFMLLGWYAFEECLKQYAVPLDSSKFVQLIIKLLSYAFGY